MLKIVDLYELNIISITFRVILSVIIGGILGFERSRKSRPAGFRTYMLVCVSSALVMMTSQYIFNEFEGTDPARLGAQVISGIGFLGVGTIIVTSRNQVRGLTTAAGLWTAACLGLAIGIGFYEGAIVVGLITLLIMTVFKKFDDYLNSNNAYINIYASFISIDVFDEFIEYCKTNDIKIKNIETTKSGNYDDKGIIAIMFLQFKKRISHVQIIQSLSAFEGLRHIEEL